MESRSAAIGLVCALCLWARGVCAQEPGGCTVTAVPASGPAAPTAGLHRHDGFMARLNVGFGAGRTRASGTDAAGPLERVQSGFAGSLSVDMGGAPVENLIVHGRLSGHTIVSPAVTLNDVDYGRTRRASVGANLLGAGVTYYLMPFNLYATGVVGLGWLTFADPGDNRLHSRAGIGANADLGKEWWIAADVGLGAALRFWYTHATQRNADLQLNADNDYLGWALLGSFTWQ